MRDTRWCHGSDGRIVSVVSAAENKQLMQDIFSELAKGNRQPFRDAMADDFCWTIAGSTAWSGTYRGKQTVLTDLFAPLFAQFADEYTNAADRFIAEDDHVVVQCRGRVTTKSGTPYNNTYCYVCRLDDGKLRELTEYLDTELVTTALAPPDATPANDTSGTASLPPYPPRDWSRTSR